MNKSLMAMILGAIVGGGIVWVGLHHGGEKPETEAKSAGDTAEEASGKARITHDAQGNVVMEMSDEIQRAAGIVVATPKSVELEPELKAYGRVIDPAPLAEIVAELSSARAAYAASSNEWARLKSLESQGNASTRALQAAEAAALHDQSALQSAQVHLGLALGGSGPSGWPALLALCESLISREAALVRIDLPPSGEVPPVPTGARLSTLSGAAAEAELLGAAPNVDPLTQGRGYIFLVKSNAGRFLAGEAVAALLKLPGNPISGVVVPRDSVVRSEGKGWIYILNEGGKTLTRKEIPLDHAVTTGWFVAQGVAPAEHIVVTGAQTLLSEEQKAALGAD